MLFVIQVTIIDPSGGGNSLGTKVKWQTLALNSAKHRIQLGVFVSADKLLEPKSDANLTMKEILQDPLLLPKIAFFCDITWILERFPVKFQTVTDAPMDPFLRSNLEKLFRSIGKMVLKEEILTKTYCVQLTSQNLLPDSEVKLSFSVKDAL